MQLKNNTQDNIPIFAGLFVPANSISGVDASMVHMVRASPLIAAYVQDGAMEIIEAPVAAPTPEPTQEPAPTKAK